jgi:parallel beta-helix repeat protein
MRFTILFLLLLSSAFALNVSTCQVISSPDFYELNESLYGAPNSLPPIYVLKACIHINSSDVVLDCKGHSISYNNTGNAIGIHVYEADNVTIKNCQVYNMSYMGIALYHTNNSLVQNNNVSNCSVGFILYDSDDSTVTGNIGTENGLDAFTLSANSSNNTITNNVANNNGQTGFSLSSSCDFNTFVNNVAYDNARDGFSVQTSVSNNLTDNDAYDNYKDGFYLGYADNSFIVNNDAYGNNESGFVLSNSGSNKLEGNNAYNNNQSGFFVAYDSDLNNLTANKAYSNLRYGLYIFYSNNSNVSDMHLYDNYLAEFFILTDTDPRAVNLHDVIFDNPLGNLQNYTNLTLSDIVEASSLYIMRWSTNSTALPLDTIPFRQKFMDISASVYIDSIAWNWLDNETAGYDESLFALWEYSASWAQLSAVLDTDAHTLTFTDLHPTSTYGILQYNDTQPPGITLNSPANGYSASVSGPTNITFNFTATDDYHTTLNCTINLNGSSIYSNSSVLNNTPTTHTSSLSVGTYTWNVTCVDAGANSNTSQTYSFTLNQAVPSEPSEGEKQKHLSVSQQQVCPGEVIKVTVVSGTSPLAGAEVRLIHPYFSSVEDKTTSTDGEVSFEASGPGEYRLIVDKSGYYGEGILFDYSECPEEEREPEPQPPPPPEEEKPPEEVIVVIPPSLNVSDQEFLDESITVDSAYLDGPGCIVIHLVDDGKPGAVVGKSSVIHGSSNNIAIALAGYGSATEFFAMLHYDDGDGICDPSRDVPVTVDGMPLMVRFAVTMPPPVAPPAEPAAPQPAVSPPPEEEGDGLLALLFIIVITMLVVAAYMLLRRRK